MGDFFLHKKEALAKEEREEDNKALFGLIRINTPEEDNQYELAANPR